MKTRTVIGALTMLLFTHSSAAVVTQQVSEPMKRYSVEQQVNQQKIANLVNQVGSLADASDFTALQHLYADEVIVDYSSLSGEEASLKSSQQLMQEWAMVLPGFDVTSHNISNIQVSIEGNRANATADVVADHFVNDLFWQVTGSYRYELVNTEGVWKIAFHQFSLINETGTRDVFKFAIENARKNPSDFVKAQDAKTVVKQFLLALEQKDMQAFAKVWNDDAIQDMPYSPEGFPKRVSGKQNLIDHYAMWPEISGQANFTDNLRFYPMQDPSLVFVEYNGVTEITATNRIYNQTYGGLFHIENGKISLFREYYDPIAFSKAFGLNEGLEF